MSSASNSFALLPALHSLGKLVDVRPIIVIDTREQTPLPITRLAAERGTLQTGDYSFRGGRGTAEEITGEPDFRFTC